MRVHVATTDKEVTEALSLVYREYLAAGLIDKNDKCVRRLRHHGLATTHVLVVMTGEDCGGVIATLTLVVDGSLGLPLESAYPEEVEILRQTGQLLAETSCLASSGAARSAFRLMDFTREFARSLGVDTILTVVNPRHQKFYARAHGFIQIGEPTLYSAVKDNEAVLLSLRLGNKDIDQQKITQSDNI